MSGWQAIAHQKIGILLHKGTESAAHQSLWSWRQLLTIMKGLTAPLQQHRLHKVAYSMFIPAAVSVLEHLGAFTTSSG